MKDGASDQNSLNSPSFPIAIIHPVLLFGIKLGGIETYISDFIKRAPADLKLRVIGISNDKNLRPPGRWHRCHLEKREFYFFPVLYLAHPNRKSLIPLSFRFVLKILFYRRKIMPEIGCSLLDFHRIESSLPFLGTNNPKVAFLHVHKTDLEHPDAETKWKKLKNFYPGLERAVFRRMDTIISVTRPGVELYRGIYPELRNKFIFLPNWVDTAVFYPLPEAERSRIKAEFYRQQHLDPDDRLILFVGRLEGQKNPELLLKSFSLCRKGNPNLILILIGTGALEKKLKRTARNLGIENSVRFLGQRERSYIARIANIASVFLLTSSFEGMPISLLEALACGLPVVSTDVGEVGLLVISKHNGLLVNNFEAEEITRAVHEVLSHPATYRRKPVADSIKRYYPASILGKLYQLHRELIHD